MFVTREADYAVRCVLMLARVSMGQVVRAAAIASEMAIPRVFVDKILQRLTRAKLTRSHRGAKGGYSLARAPNAITLFDVIASIQGCAAMNVCAVDERACSLSGTCPVHPIWVDLRESVDARLKATRISDLIQARG